jgi:CIC family chloride channel protein
MRQQTPQPNIRKGAAGAGLPPRFWLLVVLTGIGAGLGGGLLMKLLHATQHFSWSYQTGTFLEGVQQSTASRHVLILLCAGLVAGVGRRIFRSATGGHAGELAQTIWFHSGKLPTVATLARATLSIVLVGMGTSLGREGALKQTGAAMASRLAAWARLSAAQTRLLVACGAGAGIAAAYNVPCGGAVFALEVLLGDLALSLVVPALTASFLGTAVSWLLLPDRPTYTVPAYHPVTVAQVVGALVLGPLIGLAAVYYIRVIAWADARKPHGWRLVLAPVLVLTALGFLSLAFPQLLGNGKDTVQMAFTDQLDLPLLLALPALKLLATASCLGSGAPGGLFTPTLTVGSLLGGLIGWGWTFLWPGAPVGSFAILGAGALYAATSQGPVSAVLLLLELTWWSTPLVVPLLFAVVGATLITRRFESRSIYTARIRQGKTAAAGITPAAGTDFDDLVSPAPGVVSAAAHGAEVMRRLLGIGGRPSPLYVVDEGGRLLGEITAARLPENMDRSIPSETTTAADLAVPVQTLTTAARREEVMGRLADGGPTRLPIVDAASGRLVGVVDGSLRGSASRGSGRLLDRSQPPGVDPPVGDRDREQGEEEIGDQDVGDGRSQEQSQGRSLPR